jgi:hypothetical protein
VDPGFGLRALENREEQVLALGVFHRTGRLALLAAYAAFRIDEHGLHERTPFFTPGVRQDGGPVKLE